LIDKRKLMTELTVIKQESNSIEEIGLGILHSEDQYLTFLLKNELYAVDILCVEEIRGWDEPTMIPNSPNYIKGVINLRGRIVPVSDLRERFSICEPTYDATTVVIILTIQVEGKERQMGIVVDAVSDVVNGNGDDLEKAPNSAASEASRFVEGLLNVDNHVISVLDLQPLLVIEDDNRTIN